jgi:hypothetical protein
LLETLKRHAQRGAVVLVTASRNEDAQQLGGEAHALERGLWLDSAEQRTPLRQATLRVETPAAERLLARLANAPGIRSVTRVGATELVVRGADLERLAATVVSDARAESIPISALREEFAPREPLAAARAGIAQALNDASLS